MFVRLAGDVEGDAMIDRLRSVIRGEVIAPGDDGYDDARAVWNGQIDRRPALVVRCVDADDVVAAVRFAERQDLAVAVRGGGHSFAGFGTCDGGVVVDLGAMNAVHIDPTVREARVQAGATWGDFDRAGAPHGLATTGGLVSTTGVGGLTLGGGIGWLMRKHGMACDNVITAEVVTASGEQIRASDDEHAELLWALRGGGGNFGVVTSFTYRVHPVSTVVGGALLFPASSTADVFAAYAASAADEPDELCSLLEVATGPDGQPVIVFAYCHCGAPADGRAVADTWRAVAPVVADFVGEMPYPEMQ